MTVRCTAATPAGVPRSRSPWTRRERAEIRRNLEELEAQHIAYRELYGDDDVDDLYEHVEDDFCDTCNGDGFIVVCCDDICVGRGSCIHGDGEIICPGCGGTCL